jgi:hypothetical protein
LEKGVEGEKDNKHGGKGNDFREREEETLKKGGRKERRDVEGRRKAET